MRRLQTILLLLAVCEAASAQTALTVGEFDQYLATIEHARDGEAAHGIAGRTLKERASASDLARWQAEFKGEKARRALTAVGDIAEFLAPPSPEIADEPAPTAAAQREILNQTAKYVMQTLHRLPNFFAVRTTTRFEITTRKQLAVQEEMSEIYQMRSWTPRYEALGAVNGQALFFSGEWQFVVTYRDGAEVSQSQTGNNRHPPPLGLETKGEFGPILATVLGDALKGSIAWSRWEHSPNGLLAVFQYNVPKDASHYAVENEQDGTAEVPGYHGELAIAPGTGTVYRITLTAEGSESSATRESNISVDYGPVEIGGKTYICPLHGVAYTESRLMDAMGRALPGEEQIGQDSRYLNDTTFTQFHLFRSEVKILMGDPPL